nr:MAG TPA: hypothetical protein [Caudoviricetes sp.]
MPFLAFSTFSVSIFSPFYIFILFRCFSILFGSHISNFLLNLSFIYRKNKNFYIIFIT